MSKFNLAMLGLWMKFGFAHWVSMVFTCWTVWTLTTPLSMSLLSLGASHGHRENISSIFLSRVIVMISCWSFSRAEVSVILRTSSKFFRRNRHIWCRSWSLMEVRQFCCMSKNVYISCIKLLCLSCFDSANVTDVMEVRKLRRWPTSKSVSSARCYPCNQKTNGEL